MASSGAELPVLRFDLPHLPRGVPPRRLLWPAQAFRVVAPRPRPRRLNVFQKATLGLCAAGMRRAEDIGERLRIAPDLAALVITELSDIGWLDALHRPTAKGREVLEEDGEEALEEQTVGWIFTDPFTGEIWPRFHAGELRYHDAEIEKGWWTLHLGTAGAPKDVRAFEVRPRRDEPIGTHRPSPEQVLGAVRAHRRRHAWEDELVAADAPAMKRVSFVDEQAVSCLLLARAWLAEPGDFRVDDPFGIGDSQRLRRWVEERFDRDSALRDWLAPVAGGAPEATDVRSLAQRATWEVETRLTLAVRSQPELHERLVAMQRAALEAELEGSPADKWEDVVVKAQRAVERLFILLFRAHPPRTRLSGDPVANAELLDALARDMGFDVPLPSSLARVKSGKVEHAARVGSGSLRPLVLVALLGTSGHADHPLSMAAREEPKLLHQLDALAELRDRAAHEGSGDRRRPRLEQQRVREAVEIVFRTTKILLPR
jgi:hypothetical protein